MKQFESSFFDVSHFIASEKIFNYLPADDAREQIHVSYNVNDAYIPFMGASMVSVIENNKGASLLFHIFTDGYSDGSEENIRKTAQKFHCCCYLYRVNMEPFKDFHIKVSRFSRVTYVRLYMPKVLGKYADRYIYADSDTMCISSLKPLMHLDMKGYAIAAAADRPDSVKYRSEYLKLKNGRYFNDGIMLVDCKQWEKDHITEKAFSFQCEPKERFLGQSQDILNLVFDGNLYFLPHAYNITDGGDDYDTDQGVFIHWAGRRKPWNMVLTPFDAQWRKYNALSPWPTVTNILPIKKPENYHDFQQWGRYQKKHGNLAGYFKGIFWYSWLRMRYKLHL